MWKDIKLWTLLAWNITISIPFLIKIRKLEKDERENKIRDRMIKIINTVTDKMKFDIELINKDEIDDNPVLFIANHGSILDPIFLIGKLPSNISFFIASEYEYSEQIPFLKQYFKAMKSIFVNRENLREGVKAIGKGVENAKNGLNIFVFPEGEISHLLGDDSVAKFKGAPFNVALKSKIDIIPITLKGTREVQEKVSLFSKVNLAKVEIYLHKRIKYEEIKDLKTGQIAEKIRNIIKEEFDK